MQSLEHYAEVIDGAYSLSLAVCIAADVGTCACSPTVGNCHQRERIAEGTVCRWFIFRCLVY